MRVKVKKWGNSASIRIPASVMTAAKVRLEQPVEIREERGKIIIEPIREKKYNATSLIAQITPANCHGEIDFGSAMGDEIL